MTLHLANARIVDPASGFDGEGGVVIDDGRIVDWGAHLAAGRGGVVIDCAGHVLSPGLVDLRVKTGEPGEESRETLATASRAAVAGGITTMVVMPDTTPVIDDVALVDFIHRRGRDTSLNHVIAAGALTTGLDGRTMAEIGLMREAGAAFFTNSDHPISDSGVMKRAMAYAASHGAVVFARPVDASLSGRGVMNAGAMAARLGLAGMAKEAEWVQAARDLTLAGVTGARLVIDQVSTAGTLSRLAQARRDGADVHATVAAHSLFFNELDVGDYLTYCKVNPPFRAEDDRQALIDAVSAGDIAAVVSAHDPQPPEAKRLPFAEAEFGAAGLETLLSAVLSLVHDERLDLMQALRVLTSGPADLVGLAAGRIETGGVADLVLIDLDQPWLCLREDLVSRSTNSPFDGRRLTGRAVMTLVEGEVVFRR